MQTIDVFADGPAEDPFRLAVEAAPTGMLMVDQRGRIVLVNAHLEKLFGYSRDELLGKPVEMLVPQRFRASHPESRAAYVGNPIARPMGAGRDLFGLRKDGSEIPIEIGLNPLRIAERELVLGSVADITERTRAERERELLLDKLRGLNAELTRTLEERESLLQEVHHRVKNNLQVISSLINMQVRKLRGGTGTEALEECRTRVQAIALIHEKLYQSHDYSRVPFSDYVRSLTRSVMEALGAPTSNISFELAVESVALPVDKAIPCGLVLNELITNAVKHAFPDGRAGTIRVALQRSPGGRLMLEVQDDGVGLPVGVDTTSRPSLGLQIVRTLCEQLAAELVVESERGTSFRLTFAETSER